MTSLKTLETGLEAAKGSLGNEFYSDTWRSTSYLMNLLWKIEDYCKSLNADNPEQDFFSSEVALASAVQLMNNTYNCSTQDERFEGVREMFDSTVNHFIAEESDDAVVDLIYLGGIANFVAGMRVHAINAWIEQTSPSEQKFEALKLAKRDAMAVKQAISTLSETVSAAWDA